MAKNSGSKKTKKLTKAEKKKQEQKKKKKEEAKKKKAEEKAAVKRVQNATKAMTTLLNDSIYADSQTVTGDKASKVGMKMFGIPYQFSDAVDPRYKELNETVGRNFTENILLEAPIVTFIPGKPRYLPAEKGTKNKASITNTIIQNSDSTNSPLKQLLLDNEADYMRLYDFQSAYTEYMDFVNCLCRAGASFLGIRETTYVGSKEFSYERYDWRNYKWNSEATAKFSERSSAILRELRGTNEADNSKVIDWSGVGDVLDDNTRTYSYVQFYVDPEGTSGDSLSNSTTASQFKGMLDQSQSTAKEYAFLLNAGGLDATKAQQFLGDSTKNISAAITQQLGGEGITGSMATLLGRLTNIGGEVLKGNNIIIPDIYDSSSYSRDSLSVTIHLKSPYGNKLAYYLNIFVPMMHLLALACPRQATANSYEGPFLVKAFIEGMFSVSLGVVSSIQISKISESRSVDGLPMEVDVTLTIQDLYSDLMMTPASDPLLFINNSSLVEFLATNCGLSLTKPNYDEKVKSFINMVENKYLDVPNTAKSLVNEYLNRIIMSGGLTN